MSAALLVEARLRRVQFQAPEAFAATMPATMGINSFGRIDRLVFRRRWPTQMWR